MKIIEMYPMTFPEFLTAVDDDALRDYIEAIEQPEAIPDIFFNRLLQRMREYFFVGGMPEAVASWSERQDAGEVEDILEEILFSYERDMGKHPDKSDVQKIHYLWSSVPSQLARENKKFLYSAAKEGARAREYENGLNWLVNADILKKVYAVSRPGLPLDAYDDLSAFKIYMNDIGLLRKKAGVRRDSFLEETRVFTEFKGAFAENYVLQSLLPQLAVAPRYWKDARHEVDFVMQWEGGIIPFEVKAGGSIKTTSMKRYGQQYRPRFMVRVSLRNLSFDGEILNVPLFLVSEWQRIAGGLEAK